MGNFSFIGISGSKREDDGQFSVVAHMNICIRNENLLPSLEFGSKREDGGQFIVTVYIDICIRNGWQYMRQKAIS